MIKPSKKAIPVLIGIMVIAIGWLYPGTALAQVENPADQTNQREAVFSNGDVQLSGTLYLPEGSGPYPAVVMMHGSGPDSRAPYFPDASMLAKAGVAALIFDKRGTGESSGDWANSSLQDLMADGLAGIEWLKKQPEIDPNQVGVIGSSQGAWLAPFMAAQSDQVAFFIQITGSATPLANQEMWDEGNSLRELGFSETAIRTTMKAMHLLYSSRGLIQRGILPLGDLWFVYYDPFLDPADAWQEIQVPGLVLYGGMDSTVPTQTSLENVKRFLAQGSHPASRIVVFPNKGHALGGPSRNADPEYSSLVTGWIKAVTSVSTIPAMPYPDQYDPPETLRWYGLGSATTPWYAAAGFQLAIILVFLVGFLCALVASLLPWVKVGRSFSRVILGLSGAVNLFLIAGLLVVINYLLNADAEKYSPEIPLSGWLFPLAWLSVLLAVGLTYGWVSDKNRKGFGRGLYGFEVVLSWMLIPFLGYWGLFLGRL